MTEPYVPNFIREEHWKWAEFFRDLKYKPGSSFKVFTYPNGMAAVSILIWVPDSRYVIPEESGLTFTDYRVQRLPDGSQVFCPAGTPPLIEVGKPFTLPPWTDANLALEFIRRCIHEIELHESDEWIKFKGELKFDPHKPKPPVVRVEGLSFGNDSN